MINNTYIRALTRFWWVVAVGAAVALFAGVEMVASIHPGVPPKVTLRTPPTYTASQLLLVNSGSNPYLRTSVTNVVPRAAKQTLVRSKASGKATPPSQVASVPQPPSISVQQPNVQTLVRAANFYPRLIESDLVLAVRKKLFGPLHGTITAAALNAFQTPSRYRPSSFPIIQVDATAHHAKAAMALALATTRAFEVWLSDSQQASGVPVGQRILIQNLQAPTQAVSSGGPKKGLPLFIGFAVLVGFLGFATVLDRLRPIGGADRAGAVVPGEAAPAAGGTHEADVERFPTGIRATDVVPVEAAAVNGKHEGDLEPFPSPARATKS